MFFQAIDKYLFPAGKKIRQNCQVFQISGLKKGFIYSLFFLAGGGGQEGVLYFFIYLFIFLLCDSFYSFQFSH